MKSDFICFNVANAHSPLIDQNKKFLIMVRENLMFDDGGG
jgi:hypothetical protein